MKSQNISLAAIAHGFLSFILMGCSCTQHTTLVSCFFVTTTTSRRDARNKRTGHLPNKGVLHSSRHHDDDDTAYARLTGYIASETDRQLYESALQRQGFVIGEERRQAAVYRFHPASGMLQLVQSADTALELPRWVPVVHEQENVLVKNGWSFLDVDESETLSSFDVEAANREGLYQPKWGREVVHPERWSALGFSLRTMTEDEVLAESDHISDQSRKVLLEGATDPPRKKITNNQVDWTGSVSDREPGIFACAIGGLPLFATSDLSPTTASAGWLSFCRPLSPDHVYHMEPDTTDQRVEVVCAKTGCHLGHYFGRQDGYCINASALNFYAAVQQQNNSKGGLVGPVSYRSLEMAVASYPAVPLLRQVLHNQVPWDTVILGAGCFWHVEHALRRLPGVLETTTGYSGGNVSNATYKRVCQGDTGHAEVVRVDFDPTILAPRVLFDCFLALHEPTKVRAHGKHAAGTGQYRSCIFLPLDSVRLLLPLARDALKDCGKQLNKEVATDLRQMNGRVDHFFVPAEERHQRHEARRLVTEGKVPVGELSTLPLVEWLAEYGRRADHVLGSANTLAEQVAESRFHI